MSVFALSDAPPCKLLIARINNRYFLVDAKYADAHVKYRYLKLGVSREAFGHGVTVKLATLELHFVKNRKILSYLVDYERFAPSGAPVYKEPRLLVQAQSAIDY